MSRQRRNLPVVLCNGALSASTFDTAEKLTAGSRPEIQKLMLEDEDVLFAWSIASVELDEKTSSILLKLIVEL